MLHSVNHERIMNLSFHGSNAERRPRDYRLINGVVANLELFSDVSPGERAVVASYSRQEGLRRGAKLCSVGEPMPGLIAVAYGMLKLGLPRTDGEARVMRLVGPGETFGEAPVLAERPSPYDATALVDSMLVIIPRRPLQRLIEQHPGFARTLVANLADGYLALLAEVRADVRWSGEQRLASYLISIAVPNGDSSWTAHLPASKTTMAARLGMSKETLSRMLRKFSNRGVIAVSQREITLIDRGRLAEAVEA